MFLSRLVLLLRASLAEFRLETYGFVRSCPKKVEKTSCDIALEVPGASLGSLPLESLGRPWGGSGGVSGSPWGVLGGLIQGIVILKL